LSRRFLTPVNLPHGATLPAAGSAGDLFYKTTDNKVYTHNGTAWTEIQGSGGGASAVSDLTDVLLTDLADNQLLMYNSYNSKWENVDTNVLTGTNYDVLDGGSAGSNYLVTVNGGNANG
jgi:hypothetical protein